MKRNDTPPVPIEAELHVQMGRVTAATLAASAQARTYVAVRHQEVAHMVRLANAASDVMLASVRLARASGRRRKPKVVTVTELLEN
jgi:glutamate-1-semialdehyde aminotransferase